jgi:hypothetical protein
MADPIDWNELLAGGEGAANEALFGAPEWLIRKLGGGANIDAKIAQYKKAHDIGSTVGLIGGSLIPFGGMAKGALGIGKAARAGEIGLDAARAAKGAETALDVAKVAEAAGEVGKAAELADAARAAGTVAEAAKPAASLGKTLLDYGAKGAASGALEQGARGVFKDEDAAQIGKDVNQGILFGGLGGSAGGALSKSISPLLDKPQKYTACKYLASRGVNTKALKAAFNQTMPKGAKENYRVQKAGGYLRDVADYTKGISRREGAVEKLAQKTDETYDILDDAFKSQYGKIPAPKIINDIIDQMPDMTRIEEEFGPEAVKASREILASQATGKMGLVQMKSFLERAIDQARTNPKISENWAVSGALQDIASGIRGNLDDMAFDIAQSRGVKGVDIDELRKSYRLSKPLKIAATNADLTVSKPGGGPSTFEKFAASGLVAPILGGAIGGTGGALSPGEAVDKAKNTLLSSLAGAALMKGASRIGSRALGAIDTPILKLAQKVTPELAEKIAPVAGARLAANTNRAVQEAAPTTEGEAEAAKEGADLGQAARPEYMSQVLAKLTEYAKANGVEPDTQDFKDFIQTVGSATIGEDGSPFDAAKLSGMFYPDPEERAKFNRALAVSRGLAAHLPGALKSTGGILGTGIGTDPNAVMEKSTSLDMLTKLIGDAAEKSGGTRENAKKLLATALGSKATQAQKKKMIEAIMENYGVDFSTLGRVGLNV